MDRERNTTDHPTAETNLENDLLLQLKLKLIKVRADALLEELRTFEASAVRQRGIDLGAGIDFYDEIKRFETDLIVNALKYTSGHQSKAARILNVKLSTLNSKIKHYRIPIEENDLPGSETAAKPSPNLRADELTRPGEGATAEQVAQNASPKPAEKKFIW